MLKIGKRDKIKVREKFSLVERLKATEALNFTMRYVKIVMR